MSKEPTVLVIVTDKEEADPLIGWAQHFARAKRSRLYVICPLPAGREDSELERFEPEALAGDPLLVAIAAAATEGEVPAVELRRGVDPLTLVLKAIDDHQARLLVSGSTRGRPGEWGELDHLLMAKAPCEVILLRADAGSAATAARSLVPTAGGPHAQAALRLAHGLAEDVDGELTALYVEQDAGEDAEALGNKMLQEAVKKAGLSESPRIRPKVVLGDRVTKAIGDAAHEGYHLIMIGASNLGLIRRVLFGTVPETLVRGAEGTAIGIVRAAPPLLDRARAYLGAMLLRWVPQLERADRVELYRELKAGSELSFNFVTLITLSTAIAALGLTQNSAAVVIGAMLVAPLMTPMLGAGFALVQGNVVLVRKATVSIAVGAGLALATGFFFGWFSPIKDLTPELLARGKPNILDLFIALFSGAAGAFATARPGLSGALPGVAIAAALVPPIATVGVSLAYGDAKIAYGAAILFVTNLIAIILSGALTLFILGVRPHGKHSQGRVWVRRSLEALILAAVLIAIPLGTSLLSQVTEVHAPLQSALKEAMRGGPLELAWIKLEGPRGNPNEVVVAIYNDAPLPHATAWRLKKVVLKNLHREVKVRIVTLIEARRGAPSAVPPARGSRPRARAGAGP